MFNSIYLCFSNPDSAYWSNLILLSFIAVYLPISSKVKQTKKMSKGQMEWPEKNKTNEFVFSKFLSKTLKYCKSHTLA